MKKIFLSAVIALALCSYGYAQDDEEYEEEDEVPAKVVKKAAVEEEEEEEEDEAPVAKKKEKKAKKNSGDQGFFGIGLDLTGLISRDNVINFTFRLNDDMMLSAIFGFQHYGESTVSSGGQDADLEDDATVISVGAAFDYIVAQKFIPFSIGGEFLYNSLPDGEGPDAVTAVGATEGNSRIDFGIMAGVHGTIVPKVVLSGKAGLEFKYSFGDVNARDPESGDMLSADYSHLDFGLLYRVYVTWFAF